MQTFYIFYGYNVYHVVEEKLAHTYLRHPSKAQEKILEFVGAINASDYTKMIKTIEKEKLEKFGKIGQGEENDNLIMESREYTEARLQEELAKFIAGADKDSLPRKFDYLVGNIAQGDNSFNTPADSLKDAISQLKRR